LKAENNRRWRQRNPDYYRNDYCRLRAWLEHNPGYLKRYRQSHPEYLEKNRKAQKVRDRRKKLRLDIQAQLEAKPLEMTFLFSTVPRLDLQTQMGAPIFPPYLQNRSLGSVLKNVSTGISSDPTVRVRASGYMRRKPEIPFGFFGLPHFTSMPYICFGVFTTKSTSKFLCLQ
jgi:hypothetical protein